jgi:hypothetical protein
MPLCQFNGDHGGVGDVAARTTSGSAAKMTLVTMKFRRKAQSQ